MRGRTIVARCPTVGEGKHDMGGSGMLGDRLVRRLLASLRRKVAPVTHAVEEGEFRLAVRAGRLERLRHEVCIGAEGAASQECRRRVGPTSVTGEMTGIVFVETDCRRCGINRFVTCEAAQRPPRRSERPLPPTRGGQACACSGHREHAGEASPSFFSAFGGNPRRTTPQQFGGRLSSAARFAIDGDLVAHRLGRIGKAQAGPASR